MSTEKRKFTNLNKKLIEQKNIKINSNLKDVSPVIKYKTFQNISKNRKEKFNNLKIDNDYLIKKENKIEKKINKFSKKASKINSPLKKLKKGSVDVGIHAMHSLKNLSDEDDIGANLTSKVATRTLIELKNHQYRKDNKIIKTKNKFIKKQEKNETKKELIKFLKNDIKTNKFYIKEDSLNQIKSAKESIKTKRQFKKINKLGLKGKISNYFKNKIIQIKNLPKSILKYLAKFLLKFTLIFSLLILVFILLQAFILPMFDETGKKEKEKQMLMILNTQSNDDELPKIETPSQFLKIYGPRFREIGERYNVYASVMMAQAILESNWGRNLAGTRTNIFGIKCYNKEYGCASPVNTQEDEGGKKTIKASFQEAPYGGIDNAILLYLDFLEKGNAFKQHSVKLTKTYHKTYKSAVESLINDLHYATDKKYISKIIKIIEEHNLTIYDTPENPEKPIIKDIKFIKRKNIGTNIGMPVPLKPQELNGYITSPFGYRESFTLQDGTIMNAGFHYGIDIAMPMNTPIYATHSGKVTYAKFNSSGYGNVVFLDKGKVQTRYAHLNKILVKEGDIVKAGDQIGLMGTTGWSSGVHLHFEVRLDGNAQDPYPYLTKKKKY